MPQPTTQDRQRWLRWHFAHGANVLRTCQQFGISRSTLYRWLGRYDPAAPRTSLQAHSRRPQQTRSPRWTVYELCLLSELTLRSPQWGRRRLQAALARQTQEPRSATTVGRMLHRIAQRCPVCAKRGKHDRDAHCLAAIRVAYEGPGALAYPKQPRLKKSGDPEQNFLLLQAQELADGWGPPQGHEAEDCFWDSEEE